MSPIYFPVGILTGLQVLATSPHHVDELLAALNGQLVARRALSLKTCRMKPQKTRECASNVNLSKFNGSIGALEGAVWIGHCGFSLVVPDGTRDFADVGCHSSVSVSSLRNANLSPEPSISRHGPLCPTGKLSVGVLCSVLCNENATQSDRTQQAHNSLHQKGHGPAETVRSTSPNRLE